MGIDKLYNFSIGFLIAVFSYYLLIESFPIKTTYLINFIALIIGTIKEIINYRSNFIFSFLNILANIIGSLFFTFFILISN